MSTGRRLRLWGLVVARAGGGQAAVGNVCDVAVTACGVDGAAVTVALSSSPRENVYASDPVASAIEELTSTLGDGPGVDAMAGDPALAADLAAPDCSSRWPGFAPAAIEAGIRAVFAFPLQVGAIRLGVMSLCRAQPGALGRERLADALMLADTTCALLLDAAPYPGHTDGREPEQAALQHPEVHQATGMIAVQLGATAVVALSRLRAHAYAHDRRLRDVAADVVARRLRFRADGD